MQRVTCVWLPNWPIGRLTAQQPALDERPAVLFAEVRNSLRVIARSASAAAAGVRAGMTLAEARTLLPVTAVYSDYEPHADREALRRLCLWCQRYGPFVGVEPAETPECLVIDTTGCGHLFGGERSLLQHLIGELQTYRLTARVAVSDTLGASWAVSHFGDAQAAVVPSGAQERVLSPLPVDALRLPADITATLRDLDVRTVGSLLAIPRDSLRSRFGDQLLMRLDQALGKVPETINYEHQPEPVRAAQEFEHPLCDRSIVEAVLVRLIQDVAGQLSCRGLATTQIVCRFHHPTQDRSVTLGLLRPTACPSHLWKLLDLRLEQVVLPVAVHGISIEVDELQPVTTRQTSLLLGNDFDADSDVDELIERLVSRLGDSAVLVPALVPDYQPERAFRFDPAMRRSPHSSPVTVEKIRPPCLLAKPVRVSAVSTVPDGPPVRFQWQGTDHVVVHCWGPERIDTGWWREQHTRRDYYRVETKGGWRFWLFRDRATGQWYLHGSFD